IYIDFFDGATAAEQSAVQTIALAAPYGLNLTGTDPTVFATSWRPEDMPGLELLIDAAPRIHALQEDNTGIASTQAAVGSSLGQIDDPSPSAHTVWPGSTATRP